MNKNDSFSDDYFDDFSIEKYFLEKFKIDIKNKSLKDIKNEILDFISKIPISNQPTYAQHSRAHKSGLDSYARKRILFYSAFRDEEEYIEEIRRIEESKRVKEETIFTKPADAMGDKVVIKGGQVTLYEFKDINTNINSYAYYENESLVIDYWKLGNFYEDEYFITIKKEDLYKLFWSLQITNNNRVELLLTIAEKFSGKDCFRNFEAHLESNKIKYERAVRHDEK